MGFIGEIAKEVIVDGTLGVAATALGAIGEKLDEGTRKREEKNKKKIAKIAKNSKYANCEILAIDENGGIPKYEIRGCNSQIEFATFTKGNVTSIQNFQGQIIATVVSGKMEKKGHFSKTNFHQIIQMYIAGMQYGFVETNYSNDNQTIKVSTKDWNLWFGVDEKKCAIDDIFSISPQQKVMSRNYLLEYEDEDKKLGIILTAIAIMEARRQLEKAR
ncbi:MAG: hypothetical protein IJ608_00585 [Lachnospiraceae bacterium]|nr:hypothetical protein [Lachnospiraceae bacterium]